MEITWSLEQLTEARIFIGSLIFILIYGLYRQFVRTEQAEKMLVLVNGRLEASQSLFNWSRIKRRLIERGVDFYHPKIIKPYYYILVHLLFALLGFFVGWMMTMILNNNKPIIMFALLGMVIGVFFPTLYFNMTNKKDNEELISDAMTISNVLSLQLKGGEFVGSALAECKDIIYHKRLRKALYDFDRHLKLQDMTISEAVADLSSKFDCPEINTICLILKQGMETGRLTECSADLARQCSASKQSVFEKQKARLDRTLTYVMLLLFGAGIGFLMWRFMEKFTSTMGDTGFM